MMKKFSCHAADNTFDGFNLANLDIEKVLDSLKVRCACKWLTSS